MLLQGKMILSLAVLRFLCPAMFAQEKNMAQEWPAGKTHALDGMQVTLSAPVLVGRHADYFWYPQVTRFPNGELAALIRFGEDTIAQDGGAIVWSSDGGLTWSEPNPYTGQSTSLLPLASGEVLLLPFHMYTRPNGMAAPATVLNGNREIKRLGKEIEVTGWPRPDGINPLFPKHDIESTKKLGRANFYFDGQPLRLKDGTYLATLYGTFQGAPRYCALAAESADGFKWRIRSTVADEKCKIVLSSRGVIEGPCEPTLARLKDGQLMSIFRINGTRAQFGQSWSKDEGKTWTEPVSMQGQLSVEPSLEVLKNGTVLLSGGRPDLYIWVNADGSGKSWHTLDTLEHHNSFHAKEQILRNDKAHPHYGSGRSSSYTELLALDEKTLLYVYDRTPLTRPSHPGTQKAKEPPTDPVELYSVWIVRVQIEFR